MNRFFLPLFILILLAITGCNSKPAGPGSYLARDRADYNRIGITTTPSPWEDGMRSTGQEGTYEWWYTDAHFNDGTHMVVVFYSKHLFDVKGPGQPTITVNIDFPDGRRISREVSEKKNTILRASRKKCDVSVKNNSITYNRGIYSVDVHLDDIELHMEMKPRIPMWRPGTGHWYFGNRGKYFAWFVAVPSADVTGRLTVAGKKHELKGKGYHDHNWGNEEMNEVFNHWYWSRVVFDNYTVIACDLVSHQRYNYTRMPVFMIAKDGRIINDNEGTVVIDREKTVQHPVTKKFIDNTLRYTQKVPGKGIFTLTLNRKRDLVVVNLIDVHIKSPLKKWIAKLLANPTYIRTTGTGTLAVDRDGKISTMSTHALWEQMFFGSNKKPVINDFRKL
jgi:hypothetical protein